MDKSKVQSSKRPSQRNSKVAQPTSKPSEQMGSNPAALTDETLLQLKVEQRLQELSDLAKTGTNLKLKSQQGGNVEVLVKNRVKWPHEYVLSGLNKESHMIS